MEARRSYEDIRRVNGALRTMDIKGKDYVEVNQRIKAFRMLYPTGSIRTELISNEDGVCVFKAEIYSDDDRLLGVGHAQEKEDSSFINKTSYIENCETSAVGRALGMLGIGIDTSVASAEEVQNAMLQQKQITCEKCGKVIEGFGRMSASEVLAISQKKYGGDFCADCMTKMKEAKNG